MVTFVVRLADLEFLSPCDLSGRLSAVEIIGVVSKQFNFLQKLSGETVTFRRSIS